MWGKVTEYCVIVIAFLLSVPAIIVGLLFNYLLFLAGKMSKSQLLQDYSFYVLYSIDQFANTLWLGDANETVSSRTGRAMLSGKPKWFVPPFPNLVDWLAMLFGDENHVRKSVEKELTQHRELWSWIKEE